MSFYWLIERKQAMIIMEDMNYFLIKPTPIQFFKLKIKCLLGLLGIKTSVEWINK